MSNWESYDPQTPFRDDAVILADYGAPRRRSRLPLIIIGAAVVLFLLCGGIGGYYVVWLFSGHSRVVVAPVQSTDEKIAESTAAYASDDVGAKPDVLAGIERLFQRVSTAVRRSNDQEFRMLVDRDCFFARVQATGLVEDQMFVDQILLKNSIYESLTADVMWRNCDVVHVVPVAGVPDHVVVYTICRDDVEGSSEYRWWLVKRNDAWRIYDWERLDLGIPESRDWAIYERYELDSRMYSYNRFATAITAAARQVEEGDYEGAEESLRRAAECTAPPELEDQRLVLLGYNWRTCGDSREAMKCFDAVSNPRATPGAFFGKAMCYHDFGMDRKALEQIKLYETHVGPVPDVLLESVTMLDSLGRDDDVLRVRRRIAKMNPDDTAALRSFGQALPSDQKAELVPLLKQTSDPVATAAQLAWAFSGDRAGLRVVLSVIEELQPESPEAAGVAGLLAVTERDYARAVTCFQAAFDRAPDDAQQSDYLYSYLEAMSELGRYREACEESPDVDAAFEYFSEAYEDGESDLTDDAFLELVEFRRQQRPDDPWTYYSAASAHSSKSNHEAAERELRAGLKKTEDDDVKGALRSFLASVVLDQGRTRDAYETLGSDDEDFRELANQCRWNERPEQLRQLIAIHRETHSDSPWIVFFQAWLHDAAGEMDEAIELYRKSLDQIGQDNYMVQNALLEARIKADRWEEAYREAESPEVGFEEVTVRLFRKEKWDALASLVAIHSAVRPEDPSLLDWEVEILWRNKDYASLIERFTPPPQEMLWQLSNRDQSEMWEKVVRSHLRLGQIELAKLLAKQLFDENEYVMPLLLTRALSGNRVETQRWFGEVVRADSWVMNLSSNLYGDDDIGRILLSDAYRPLREEFPITASRASVESVAVLFLDQSVSVDSTHLRDAAQTVAGPDAEAVVLGSTAEELRFAIRTGPAAIWGVIRNGPPPGNVSWLDSIDGQSLSDRVDGHKAWLAVGRAYWFTDEAPSSAIVLRVADHLAGEHGVALYLQDETRLVGWDGSVQNLISQEKPISRLCEMGETVGYYYYATDRSADGDQMRAFRKKLYDVGCSFVAARPVPRVDACFRLMAGPFHESLWLRVDRVADEMNGSFSFKGRLIESSSLLPVLSKGEFVQLDEYGVVALRFGDGDETVLMERWPGASEQ